MKLPIPVSVLSLVPLTLLAGAPWALQGSFINWETPHVHPLDMTPDGTLLLAVNTPDNRLEIFDVTSGVPIWERSVPVGLDPVSVRARSDGEAWVVNEISDSISVVSLVSGNVIATLSTEDEPADVIFTSAGGTEKAFVSCSQADALLVYDPNDLSAAAIDVPITAADPRALALSPDGSKVYLAAFESGNATTVIGGGLDDPTTLAFPPNFVEDPLGPYGGQNPPPNSGVDFVPAIAAGLPTPPKVSLIVRQNALGQWLDDNGGDWTEFVSGAQANETGRPVGWTLLDHDLVIVDAANLTVDYAGGLMNACMALGVNPATGDVSVVGTDATNEIRFEPNLTGTFVRVLLGLVDPSTPGSPSVVDLNGHLDYSSGTVAPALRDQSLGDPRGIVWNSTGTRAYVTGMGSNNVVVVDPSGSRVGAAPTIEVGEGPTGIVLDEARDRLYVLNKFESAVSVVDTSTELELSRVGFFDPSPSAIKVGRKHLYDTHATSGTGLVSCASCHLDARMDRLGWDLGDPSGAMKATTGQNLGANVPFLNTGFESWHPMKGPMTTQTLQDIIGKEPHHWRGDRAGIEEFNPAFEGLLGDDEQLSATEMQEFEDFLATIYYPPNPFRNFDNSLPTDLPLPGHFSTGAFSPAGQPLPNGDATKGRTQFTPPRLLDGGLLSCVACHSRATGSGTDTQLQGGTFQPFPVGPNGEHHSALVSVDGTTNVTMKVAQLRNMHEKVGMDLTQTETLAGFGFLHDGSVDSLARFLSEPAFTINSDGKLANVLAFVLCFSGHIDAIGSSTNVQNPPGMASQSTHAAVGAQVTFGATPGPADLALLDEMLALADADEVGVVAKGVFGGEARGAYYLGGGGFQTDRASQRISKLKLLMASAAGSEITFTVVPLGSEKRIGVDRDEDRALDRDELDAGTDPADPDSKPRVRVASGPLAGS